MSKSTWVIDPSHTTAEFSVKHMMFATVKGRFTQVQGSILVDPADLAGAEFQGSVQTASVHTADEQRDAHLRSADFFDAENHPTISFRSTGVAQEGDELKLTGEMTIRGITKPVTWTLEFEGQGKDPWGNQRIGFTATTSLNRKEFGLNWNAALEAGGVLVGETVKLSVHIEAIQQA